MHLGLPGLEFEPTPSAIIPKAARAAQVLGVTDPDNNGVSGLELGLQNQLRTSRGRARPSPPPSTCGCNTSWRTKPKRRARTFDANAAGGIVMDVSTGEVLAMVSLPDFDPNARGLDGRDSTPQRDGAGCL